MRGIRKPGPKKLLWECHIRGHRPMANTGDDNMVYNLDGVKHLGRICAHCRCAYFEPAPDAGLLIKV